ncbi:uncharacterized protein LOC6525958 [Drosophila yakuba]|uniref:Uncharacterized protein n=1 Tax=Drosophila yakuba TaxID=7245 RepID=B4PXD5_DROYA|nr:uncharacterized protein LOC6525958 [Drosophila yakuba]EDX02886.1 uncharacterized protein Dyak_GE17818 [Drosophila yakuba]
MKSLVVCSWIGLVLLMAAGQVRAECDEAKSPEDSDFKHFFKNLGCKVNQGAKEVAEAAKPYTDKIGEGAKEFGSSVAHKYDELKHKLTDEPSTTPKVPVAYDAPTEKVLLAPIGGPSTPIP